MLWNRNPFQFKYEYETKLVLDLPTCVAETDSDFQFWTLFEMQT